MLVLRGFFLPWVDGTSEFASRDFSGFDLARLVRNFRVVASSPGEAGSAGLTAVALYAMPALAINGAVLAVLPVIRRDAAAVASAAGAGYTFVILSAVALLSNISWTDLERVLGAPRSGFFVAGAGGAALAVSAVLSWFHRPRTGSP